MSKRSLKISAQYRRRFVGFSIVPFLRLSGNWFRSAGFAPGQRVTVTVEQGRIIITPSEA